MTHVVEMVGGPSDGSRIVVEDGVTSMTVAIQSQSTKGWDEVDLPLVKTPLGWRVYWPAGGVA